MTDATEPFLPHGGYHKLRSYKVAQVVYDATVVFCHRFFPNDRRMTDQMVQAARSGVRNISEASGAAATSRKTEMKLTNVARASLSDELLRDYESFLIQNGLRIWPKDSREAQAMRQRLAVDCISPPPAQSGSPVRLTGLSSLADFVALAEPEIAANAMLCAINQAAYLLYRQLQAQGKAFLVEGGFSEKLYSARRGVGESPIVNAPECPRCGKPMVQRKDRKGPHTGQVFWGCSAYPKCTGTREFERPSDASDQSDASDT